MYYMKSLTGFIEHDTELTTDDFFAQTLLELCGQEIGSDYRKILKRTYNCFHVKSSPFPAYSKETLEKKQKLGRKLAERKDHALS